MRIIAKIVTCVFCKEKFDRDKLPFVQVSERRYAHEECYHNAQVNKDKKEKEKEELEAYISQILNFEINSPKIRKQLKTFIEEYNYSYSGILNTLKYWYEIKHNDITKANGGIGIVPYVYQQAYEYFYSLWLAQQRNEGKEIAQYIPTIIEITIPSPERKITKKRRFSFLDEEVEQ